MILQLIHSPSQSTEITIPDGCESIVITNLQDGGYGVAFMIKYENN